MKKFSIKIVTDKDPQSPREWDNLGTVFVAHRRYDFSDVNAEDIRDDNGQIDDARYIHLPIYMYDHSGITVRTTPFSCPWDSGQVGVIYVDKDKVREEFGWKRITKEREAQIHKYLVDEVETLDQYLTGDVYGFTVTDNETGEEIDSCWGFFGSDHEATGLLEHAGYDPETHVII